MEGLERILAAPWLPNEEALGSGEFMTQVDFGSRTKADARKQTD